MRMEKKDNGHSMSVRLSFIELIWTKFGGIVTGVLRTPQVLFHPKIPLSTCLKKSSKLLLMIPFYPSLPTFFSLLSPFLHACSQNWLMNTNPVGRAAKYCKNEFFRINRIKFKVNMFSRARWAILMSSQNIFHLKSCPIPKISLLSPYSIKCPQRNH